jgi:hypothetical protein
MERHKTSSQVSIDKKSHSFKDSSIISFDKKSHPFKDSSIISINKQNQLQNEIDNLIEHGILDPIVEYDPKLDFDCVSIINRDQVIKQTRRQTCALIWNSIRSSTISKLVPDGRSCAFVEILQIPKEWSRYDIDILLLQIGKKTFLNGLALRDEFVRVLQIILKRDFNEETNNEKKYSYEFKDVEFTRNTIQLIFHHRQDTELTLIISLILLVEFDIPCKEFFPDVYTSLCYHNDLYEYFESEEDPKRTRLTPYNSIKFLFDYSLTEAKLCEYLLQKSNSLSLILTNFLKLRKEWLKYVQRAVKYATETIKIQTHANKRQSTSSINSKGSTASNTSAMKRKFSFNSKI